MLPNIISAIGIPLLSKIVSSSLAKVQHPVAQQAAKALIDLDIDLPKDYAQQATQHARAGIRVKTYFFCWHFSELPYFKTYPMIPMMSASFMMIRSLPSMVTSVPENLPNRTRSLTLTSKA